MGTFESSRAGRPFLALASIALTLPLLAASFGLFAGPAFALAGSISGTVTYTGKITGSHQIVIVAFLPGPPQPAIGTASVLQPGGPYTIPNLPDGTYAIFAYLDSNDSGGPPEAGEPLAWYDANGDGKAPDLVTVAGGATTGIDIIVRDPPAPPPPTPPAGYISGQVTYLGSIAAGRPIHVEAHANQPGGSVVGAVDVPGPGGAYKIEHVAQGTYFVRVWLDANDNSNPDWTDPNAWYDANGDGAPDPVILAGGAPVIGIDVSVIDPWRPTGGPLGPGGQVNALVVHPTIADALYAVVGTAESGAASRIFVSQDAGAHWSEIYEGERKLNALAVTPAGVIYAASDWSRQDQILRSEDNGLHWAVSLTDPTPSAFKALSISPHDARVVFAAGEEADEHGQTAMAYRTEDAGATWTRIFSVTQGCCESRLSALTVSPHSPDIVFAGGMGSDDNGNFGAIYRSTDGGDGWTRVYTATLPDGKPAEITSLVVHPLTSSIVYAGSEADQVYRSRDGGQTWESVFDQAGLRLLFEPPNTVYALHGAGRFYRSTAGGDPGTWTLMSEPAKTIGGIRSLALDLASAPHAIYAGAQASGVWRSADSGATWQMRSFGISTLLPPRSIAIDPDNPNRLLVADGITSGRWTDDAGATWHALDSLRSYGAIGVFAINPADPQVVFAGGSCTDCSALWRSGDGGASWTPVFTTPAGSRVEVNAIAVDPVVSATVYAVGRAESATLTGGGVLVSTDGGLHWTPTLSNPARKEGFYALAIAPESRAVYAGGGENPPGANDPTGVICRSGDLGLHWRRVFTSSAPIRNISVDYQKPAVLYAIDSNGNVYKSADAGDNWALLRAGQEAEWRFLTLDPRVPSHVYLAGQRYVGESPDGGLTWSERDAPLSWGLPEMEVATLAVDKGSATQTLWAGLSGVWYLRRPAPQPGTPMTVTVTYDGPPGPQLGRRVSILGLIVDRYQNWVADGTPATFTASGAGSFGPAGAAASTADGKAGAWLNRLTAGTAMVTVTAGSAVGTLTVEFAPPLAEVWLPLVQKAHH